MKCTSCGGKLEGTMTFCPFCGVRQDVDLRQIHYRDLGQDASLPCPECVTPLGVIEFESEPVVRIERCGTCHGMFFNPGELQALLEAQTHPLVWFDGAQIQQIADDFGSDTRVTYKKCPVCADIMNRINFGKRSAVILDECGAHGIWVEGSELRRLTEWWRAGGKLVYQQSEGEKVKRLFDTMSRGERTFLPDTSGRGSIDPPSEPSDLVALLGGLAMLVASILD